MPAPPYPQDIRRQAISVVREEDHPVAQVPRELGIAVSGLRRWLAQHDVEGPPRGCQASG